METRVRQTGPAGRGDGERESYENRTIFPNQSLIIYLVNLMYENEVRYIHIKKSGKFKFLSMKLTLKCSHSSIF